MLWRKVVCCLWSQTVEERWLWCRKICEIYFLGFHSRQRKYWERSWQRLYYTVPMQEGISAKIRMSMWWYWRLLRETGKSDIWAGVSVSDGIWNWYKRDHKKWGAILPLAWRTAILWQCESWGGCSEWMTDERNWVGTELFCHRSKNIWGKTAERVNNGSVGDR